MPPYACVIALYVLGVVSGTDVDHPKRNLRAAHRLDLASEFKLVSWLLHHDTRLHFSEVQDRLAPIVSAVPAEQPGYVCHRVARYAIVRYFLVYRGWVINGLSRDAGVWNVFPADVVLQSRFPNMVLRLITQILHKPPIGMQDLVLVVAAVEALVFSNVKEILMLAYDRLGLSVEEPLRDSGQELLVMQTFALFLMYPGSQADNAEQPFLLELLDNGLMGPWTEIEMWVADVMQTMRNVVAKPFPKGTDFVSMLAMADAVSSDVGRLYNSDCLSMKHRLMDAAGSGDGRISFADFFRPELGGDHWVFRESPKYLEAIGVLDMSTPRHDNVLIANYVTLPGNCMTTSTFHQMCCINECELLLMHVEAAAGKPYVRPLALLEALAVLPSETVRAPRNLSASLRDRLFEISRTHDGTVPLHGLLFSEWMHRAFPNECPMPVGKRLQGAELDKARRQVTDQEVEDLIRKSSPNHTDENDWLQMPWSGTEELLINQDWKAVDAMELAGPATAGLSSTIRSPLRPLVIVAVATASVVYILVQRVSLLPALLGDRLKNTAKLP